MTLKLLSKNSINFVSAVFTNCREKNNVQGHKVYLTTLCQLLDVMTARSAFSLLTWRVIRNAHPRKRSGKTWFRQEVKNYNSHIKLWKRVRLCSVVLQVRIGLVGPVDYHYREVENRTILDLLIWIRGAVFEKAKLKLSDHGSSP